MSGLIGSKNSTHLAFLIISALFLGFFDAPVSAQSIGDYRTNGSNQVTNIVSGVSTSRFGTAACWDVYTGSKYGWQTATNAPTNQPTSVTMGSLSASSGANFLTFTASGANAVTTMTILPGMYVTGTNIPSGTTVTSVDASNGFIYLSANTTAAISNASVSFGWTFTITLGTVSNATSASQPYTVSTISPAIGMAVTGTNISSGTYLTSVSGGNLTLSTTPANTGLTTGQTITVYSLFISTQQTNALNSNILALSVQNNNILLGQVMPSAAGLGSVGTMVTGVNSSYTPSTTATAATTSSNTLTLASTLGIAPGMTVTSGVSGGTAPYIVTAVTSNTAVTLNQNVNASNGATINFSTGTLVYISVKPTGTRVTNTNFNFFTIPNLYINHNTVVDNNVGTTINSLFVNNTSNVYSNGIAPSINPTLYIGSNSTTAYSLSVGTLRVAANTKVQSTPNSNTVVNTLNLYGGDVGNVIINNGTIDLTAKTNATTTTVFMSGNQNGNLSTAVTGNAISFSTMTLNMGWSSGNVVDLQSTSGYTMTAATTSNTLTLNYGTLKISGGSTGNLINLTPFGTGNNGMTSNTIGSNSINGVSGISVTGVVGNTLTVASTTGLSIGQYVTSAPNSSITNSGYYISDLTATTLILSSYNPNAAALATGSYNFGTGAGAGLTINSPYVTVNALNPNASAALPTQTFIGFNLTITSNGGTVNWGTTTTPVLLTPIQTGGGGQINLAGGALNVYGGFSMYNNGGVTSISGTAQLNLPLTTTQVNTTNYFNGGTYTPFYTLSFGYNNYLFMSGGSINVANHTLSSTPYNCDVYLTSSTGGWNMTGGTININASTGTTITYFNNRPIYNLTVQNGCTFAPASAALISNSINTFTVNGTLNVGANSIFDLGIQTLSIGSSSITGLGVISAAGNSPFATANTFTGTVNYYGGTQIINNGVFNNISITGGKTATALVSSLNVTATSKNFIDCGTQSISSIPLGMTFTATGTGTFPANTYIVAAVPSATASATLTSGSTSVTAITTGIVAGMAVSGTGIAAGTYVSSVTGAFGITLSTAATASGTNSLTFNSTLFTSANATVSGSVTNLSFSSKLTLAAGTTQVNGVLTVNYTGTIGSFVTTSDTITLATAGSNSTIASPFTINVLNITSGDTLTISNALTMNGNLNLSGVLQYNASGTLSSTPVFATNATAIFNNPNYTLASTNEYLWPTVSGPNNVVVLQPLNLNGQARNIPLTGSFVLASSLTSGASLTINGTLQLNNGASISGAPTLGTSSTLIYNTGNSYARGAEWNNPANVTINNGCSLVMGAQSGAQTINGNFTINGGLTLSTTGSPNGDLYITGNWNHANTGATITLNNGTIYFSGTNNATITNSVGGTESFYNLVVNKTSGASVTLNSPLTVSNNLTLTSGIVNTSSTNIITVNNTSNTAIVGNFGSSTYINGPITWAIPSSSSNSYIFPLGNGNSYFPITLNNPTASNSSTNVTAQAIFNNAGGSADNSTVSAISGTEYWSIKPSGGNLTGGNVSLNRVNQSNTTYNLIASSSSLSGSYSSIGGTVSGTAINTSNSIATINNGSFKYMVYGFYSTTPAITGITGGFSNSSGYIGQTLTINGANFTNGTTVSFNGGTYLATTFVSSNQIRIVVPSTATSGNITAKVGSTVTNGYNYTILGYISNQAGDWSSPSTWVGGVVPPSNATVTTAHNITLNTPNYSVNVGSLTIQSGTSISFGNADTIYLNNITNNGSINMSSGGALYLIGNTPLFTNNGSFVYGIGTLGLNGVLSNTINGQNSFYNVNVGGNAALCNDTIFGSLVVTGIGQFSCNPVGGAVTLPSYPAGQSVNIYAAPNGSGVGTGASFNLPVNLARARVVAQNYPNNPVNVLLEDGTYFQLTLTSSDARTASAPAVYKAINKGKAIFQPLKIINRADFQTIPDTIKQRIIDNTAKGKVMQLDLTKYNINAQSVTPWATVVSNTPKYPIFYQNTTPLMLSRYPNDTTMSMNGVIYKGTNRTDSGGIFYYSDTRTNRWVNALNDEGVWFAGNWRVSFALQYIKTKSIDTVNKIIYQKDGVQLGIGNKFAAYAGNYKEPYFVSNLFEEIDTVGEFSINFNNKMLYMWVPDTGTIQYSDSLTMPAISATGASYTQFQNLNFVGGAGNAMKVSSANNVRIAGCDFTQCTDDAIVLTDMNYSTVQSNDFHQIGSGGVAMFNNNYNTDINTLKRCYDTVINNFFYDYANQVPLYNAAIDLGQCIGVYVANNKLRKSPHIGIAYGFGAGDLSTLEYNEVDSVVLVYSDMGAIYGTGVWKDRGHKINHNYLHDIQGANGLYLDNNTSGDTCVYNIVANSIWGMGNNGGNYNRFYKNVFINNERPAVGNYTADTIIDFVRNYPVIKNLWYSNPTWQTMFPELIDLVDSVNGVNKSYTSNYWSQMKNNVFYTFGSKFSGQTFTYVSDNSLFNADGTTNNTYARTSDPFTRWGIVFQDNLKVTNKLKNPIYPFALDSLRTPGLLTAGGATDWHINRIGLYIDSFRTNLNNMGVQGIAPKIAITTNSNTNHIFPDTTILVATITNPNIANCISSLQFFDNGTPLTGLTIIPKQVSYDTITYTASYTAGTIGSHNITCKITDQPYWQYLSSTYNYTTDSAMTWTGNTSTDWNTASNWSNNRTPLTTDIVTIPGSVTRMPILSGGVKTVKRFTVKSGATLTIQNATDTLKVTGDVQSAGAFSGNGVLALLSVSTTPISASQTWGTTVYYGANNQTVVDGYYSHLNLSGGNMIFSTFDTIFISGNLTTGSGALTTTNSTVAFNGTAAQSISGAVVFNNLVINKNGIVNPLNLGGATVINGTLNLVSGRVVSTSTNTLTVNSSSTLAIQGGSNASYVDGPLSWNVANGSNSYVFPVGDYNVSSQYMPDTLTSVANTGTITITAYKGSSGGTVSSTLTSISTNEYWSVTSSVANTIALTIAPPTLGTNNLIGQSATINGVYASVGGVATNTSISAPNITLSANTISWLVAGYYPVPIISSVVSCIQNVPSGTFFPRDTLTITGNYIQSTTTITVGGLPVTVYPLQSNYPTMVKVLLPANVTSGTVKLGNTTFNGTLNPGYVTRFDGKWNDGIANNPSISNPNYSIWLGGSAPPRNVDTITISNAISMASSVSGIQMLTINAGASFTTSNVGTTFNSGATILNNGTYTTGNNSSFNNLNFTNNGLFTATSSSSYNNSTIINNNKAILGGQSFTNVMLTNNAGDSIIISSASITISGTITNNGYFKHNSTAMYLNGSLTLNGSGVDTINSLFTNSNATGTITFTTAPYLTGNFTLNSSTFTVTGNYPIYGGNLYYNTGTTYTIGSEWRPNASSGAGVPAVVQIGNSNVNSSIDLLGGNTYKCTSTLTVNSGCTVNVASNTVLQTGGLRVIGTLNIYDTAQVQSSSTVTINSTGVLNIGSAVLPAVATTSTGPSLLVTSSSLNDSGSVTNYGYLKMSGSNLNKIGAGSFVMNNNAVLELGFNAPAIPVISWPSNSYLYLTGSSSGLPTNIGQTFGNVVWSSTTQTGNLAVSGLNNIPGAFVVLNTGSGSLRFNNTTNAFGSLQVGGSYAINGATVNASPAASFNMGYTTAGTTTVSGNVTIGANGIVAAGVANNSLSLSGNWSNNGTFTNTNSTIIFNGSSNTSQTVSKTGGESFNNLVINTTGIGGTQLASNLLVAGNMILTNGKFNLSNYHLTLGSTATITPTTPTATSYIQTGGTGKLVRQSVGNAATLFPIGTSSAYTPLTITNTTGTANDSVSVSASIANAVGTPNNVVNLQWSVWPSSNVTSTIMYQFNNTDGAAGFNPASTCELGSYTTSYSITSLGTPTANGNIYTASLANQSLLTANTYTQVIGNTGSISCVAGTYVGTSGGDANSSANWCGGLPTSSTNVIIAANTPILTSNLSINNLSLNAGINLNGFNLTVNGAITGSGTITGSPNSSITLSNTANGTLNFNQSSPLSSNVVNNLTINTSGSVTIGSPLYVKGTVFPLSGSLATGGNLTLLSDINGTARIDKVIGSITGNITVQRYIPNKTARKYSFVAATTSQTIRSAWQNQIYITGSGAGGQTCGTGTGNGGATDRYNSNGFDKTNANSSSMFTYNATAVNGSRWVSVPNTNATNLTPGVGYRINIRGDRNSTTVNCNDQLNTANPTAPESVVLSSNGTVTTGNINVSLNNPNAFIYSLIGNPYPSQISFTVLYGKNSSNITNKMWTLSPYGNGNYTTYSSGVIANGATNYDNTNGDYIASGQAFIVESKRTGSGIVTFEESHKTSGTLPNNQYFGTANQQLIRVKLATYQDSLLDETVIRFNRFGSDTYNTDWDAISFGGGTSTLALLKGTSRLAIATFADIITIDDSIRLSVKSSTTGSYKLSFTDIAGLDSNKTYWLKDYFLNTLQDIRISSTYNFNITADTASKVDNRFVLIRKPSGTTLPLKFIAVTAKATSRREAVVSWKVAAEKGIKEYIVERSIYGNSYASVATVNANSSFNYEITDSKLPEGITSVYYRIKAMNIDGTLEYSNVAKLRTYNLDLITYSIYPNPAKDWFKVTLPTKNINEGVYTINILSVEGKQLLKRANIKISNGNELLVTNVDLLDGIYLIKVSNDSGEIITSKLRIAH